MNTFTLEDGPVSRTIGGKKAAVIEERGASVAVRKGPAVSEEVDHTG